MYRLLIVDDHPIYRVGLRITLARNLPEVHVADAASAELALAYFREFPDTDLVLIDVRMPVTDGFALLRQLGDSNPQVARLMISGDDNPDHALRAQRLGAAGFLPKSMPVGQCVAAVRSVLSGGLWFPHLSGQLAAQAVPGASPCPPGKPKAASEVVSSALTLRQLEVLWLLAQGQSNKGIARSLNIAERTVKAHLSATFEFLGARSRTQALLEAARRGLLAD